MTNVDRVTEIVRRLGDFDFDGVAEMLSPAFVQEYPYLPMPASPSRIEGAAAFLEFCRAGMTSFAPYAFRIDAIYETTDPQLIIAEYSSHTHLLDTNAPYSNRYVGMFRFGSDDKLVLWREYLNPQIIADAFGA
ncbi:MAG: nuclear transport factor 2 family protein [Acidimicrobiales bacterium]